MAAAHARPCYTGSPRRVRRSRRRARRPDRHGAGEHGGSLGSPRSHGEHGGLLWDRHGAHGEHRRLWDRRDHRGNRGMRRGEMASDIIRLMAIRVIRSGSDRSGPPSSGRWRRAAGSRWWAGSISIRRRWARISAQVTGLDRRSWACKVSADARKAIKATKPDVVVLCTSSSLKKVWPQIEEVLKLRVPIVSTTEELAYPAYSHKAPGHAHRQGGAEGEGRGAGHGRQPGLHDGRTADHAHRRLRQCRSHHGQPDSGRAIAPAAVPAEDRLRSHAPRSSRRAWTPAPCGTWASPNRSR